MMAECFIILTVQDREHVHASQRVIQKAYSSNCIELESSRHARKGSSRAFRKDAQILARAQLVACAHSDHDLVRWSKTTAERFLGREPLLISAESTAQEYATLPMNQTRAKLGGDFRASRVPHDHNTAG